MSKRIETNAAAGRPVSVDLAVEIARPAADVYALIDFADPRNAKHQLGEVRQTGPASFSLSLDVVPDMLFSISVTEEEAPRLYAFSAEITPRAGQLLHNTERYEIAPDGSEACVLRLVCEATFVDDLASDQFAHEAAMLSLAVQNALAKLKIHAEQGVDTVREIEHWQMA